MLDFESPKPRGANSGARAVPKREKILSFGAVAIDSEGVNERKNQITIDIKNMSVPAFTINPLHLSRVLLSTDEIFGIR